MHLACYATKSSSRGFIPVDYTDLQKDLNKQSTSARQAVKTEQKYTTYMLHWLCHFYKAVAGIAARLHEGDTNGPQVA